MWAWEPVMSVRFRILFLLSCFSISSIRGLRWGVATRTRCNATWRTVSLLAARHCTWCWSMFRRLFVSWCWRLAMCSITHVLRWFSYSAAVRRIRVVLLLHGFTEAIVIALLYLWFLISDHCLLLAHMWWVFAHLSCEPSFLELFLQFLNFLVDLVGYLSFNLQGEFLRDCRLHLHDLLAF